MLKISKALFMCLILSVITLPTLNAEENKYLEETNLSIGEFISVNKENLNTIDGKFVTAKDGITYYLNVTDGNKITATYSMDNSSSRSTYDTHKTYYTKFYVYGSYVDYVGKVHCTATLEEYTNSSGYTKYSFKDVSLGHYDYRENDFTVYGNTYLTNNTSTDGGKSYIQETGSWDSNKSSMAPINERFYAPKNG